MVVNQNRDLLGRISEFREVNPGADASPGVNYHILGGNPGGGVSRGRGELGPKVALNETALVDADTGERLVDELLVIPWRGDDRERDGIGGGVGVGVGGSHGGGRRRRGGGEERGGVEPEEEEEEREEDDKAGTTEVGKEDLGLGH